MQLVHEPISAQPSAWPNGCIDTEIVLDGTHTQSRREHIEVGDDDGSPFTTTFIEPLLSLTSNTGRR